MRHPMLLMASALVILAAPVAAEQKIQRTPKAVGTASGTTAPSEKGGRPCGIESMELEQFRPLSLGAEPGLRMAVAKPVKEATLLEVPSLGGAIGQTVQPRARLTLKADGREVPSHTVHFWVDGQYLGNAKTDRGGVARLSLKAEVVANRKVQGRYFGSDVCSGSKGENVLAITRSPSKIALEDAALIVREGGSVSTHGTLTRTTDGQPIVLADRTIVVSLDGQPVDKLPAWNKGSFEWSYTPPPGMAGKHNVEVRFPGNDLHDPAAANLALTVLPPPVRAKLSWNSVWGKAGEIKILTARLTVSDPMNPIVPKGMPGVMIRAWYGEGNSSKNVGKALTDGTGTANIAFMIDDDPGSYWSRAHADGVDGVLDVEEVTKLAQVNVYKGPPKVTVTAPATAKSGAFFDGVTVSVAKPSDGTPLPSMKVSVAGVAGSQTTNASGRTVFLLAAPKGFTGQLKINAATEETSKYSIGTGTATINVVP
jgi:hypothetical protein